MHHVTKSLRNFFHTWTITYFGHFSNNMPKYNSEMKWPILIVRSFAEFTQHANDTFFQRIISAFFLLSLSIKTFIIRAAVTFAFTIRISCALRVPNTSTTLELEKHDKYCWNLAFSGSSDWTASMKYKQHFQNRHGTGKMNLSCEGTPSNQCYLCSSISIMQTTVTKIQNLNRVCLSSSISSSQYLLDLRFDLLSRLRRLFSRRLSLLFLRLCLSFLEDLFLFFRLSSLEELMSDDDDDRSESESLSDSDDSSSESE